MAKFFSKGLEKVNGSESDAKSRYVLTIMTQLRNIRRLGHKLVITKDKGVRSMISIPGSLSFAKLVMMSSAPAKFAGNARYASQDPFIG